MADETENALEELRNEIRFAATRVMALALHQALLARLGKSSEETDRKLILMEENLIKMRASRDLLLFRLRASDDP
jgi:hypothetical protein